MPSLDFLRRNRRFLSFGLATAFFSSFGQTYFIGAFGTALQAEFGLTSGQFGGLYSLATLGSAVALIWTGRAIDRMPLARYSSLVALSLVGACWLMSTAGSVLWLGLALFALRQTGQGLMSHTSSTSMARRFESERGRALSIAVMGYPLGQALLPAAAVTLMRALGWRQTWAITGLMLALVLIPLLRWLLRDSETAMGTEVSGGPVELGLGSSAAGKAAISPDSSQDGNAEVTGSGASSAVHVAGHAWTRGEVLRDPRFWLVLPAAIAPGVILTGTFFHQGFITQAKGWDLAYWTGAFVVFSACQIGGSILAGLLVDRWTARAILPFFLLPLGLGLVCLALLDGQWLAPLFLALAGASGGLSMTLGGALWAEIYGVEHLGSIRSAVSSLGILGTAASPVGMGWMIDSGVSLAGIAWLAAGYLGLSVIGVLVGLNAAPRRPGTALR